MVIRISTSINISSRIYFAFLNKFEINYDEKYLFEWIE